MAAPAAPVNNPGTHGKEGIVAMKLTSGGAYVAIGNISDWTLNMATDKVETTSLGDANKRYVVGLKDLSRHFTAFWDRLTDVIFDGADSPVGCYLAFYPSGDLRAGLGRPGVDGCVDQGRRDECRDDRCDVCRQRRVDAHVASRRDRRDRRHESRQLYAGRRDGARRTWPG